MVAPWVIDDVPAAHAIQINDEVAPTTFEYVPETQGVHREAVLAPGCVDHVPASHMRHNDEDDAPPVAEYVPRGQLIHVDTSVAARVEE